MSTADAARLVTVDLTAPVALTQALLPGMIEPGSGCLPFVTSIAGRTGAGEAVYGPPRPGSTGSRRVRFELAGTGVRVRGGRAGRGRHPVLRAPGRPYALNRPAPCRPEPSPTR